MLCSHLGSALSLPLLRLNLLLVSQDSLLLLELGIIPPPISLIIGRLSATVRHNIVALVFAGVGIPGVGIDEELQRKGLLSVSDGATPRGVILLNEVRRAKVSGPCPRPPPAIRAGIIPPSLVGHACCNRILESFMNNFLKTQVGKSFLEVKNKSYCA